MRQAAVETRELFDAVGGFGDGADRRCAQRGFDLFGVAGQLADGSDDAPMPQAREAALAVGGEVALHGGPSHTRDLTCLQTGEPRIHRPEHEHLAANVQVRMRVPFGGDGRLFGLREQNRDACHP